MAAVFFLIVATGSIAQFLDQGAITEVVQDSSGAVIVKAEITLTNVDTDLALHAVTNSSGIYNFSPIPAIHYKRLDHPSRG